MLSITRLSRPYLRQTLDSGRIFQPCSWFCSTSQPLENPRKEEQKKYYLSNKEAIMARQKQYRLDNREALKLQQRQYRQENRDHINARRRELNEKKKGPPPPTKSWRTPEDVRHNLDQLAEELKIQDHTEWYRVSLSQINENGYGGMFHRFKSLGPALQLAYPEVEWDLTLLSGRNKKSVQRWLKLKLSELLPPGTIIEEEYRLMSTTLPSYYFLDLFVPQYNIALEFHGEQHYSPQKGCFGSFDQIQTRDQQKVQLCEEVGIKLIAIPYWWDKKQDSLGATLSTALPHIITASPDSKPIPSDPPKPHPVEIWGQEKMEGVGKIIMHGKNWNSTKTDPTGWIITEKYDGVRGYWDGKELYSRNGYKLNAPQQLKDMLPPGIPLDGEFWLGYNLLPELVALINQAQLNTQMNEEELQKHWGSVTYKIFDAPLHPGTYVERISYAKSSVDTSNPTANPKVSVAPLEICTSADQLRRQLQDVKSKGGEGLMIYNPTEKHVPGRSKLVQKVKVPLDISQVTFSKLNPHSISFICQQSNGVECLVKCRLYDYQNPPAQGSLMAVQHSGYHKKSNKMKSPVLVRHK